METPALLLINYEYYVACKVTLKLNTSPTHAQLDVVKNGYLTSAIREAISKMTVSQAHGVSR